ncbi:hypothetical protein TNCV_3909481 [Trichonephila clavipes]|nr:hypothetical protein TNCV_3909481 [Trichonephila clavipes]
MVMSEDMPALRLNLEVFDRVLIPQKSLKATGLNIIRCIFTEHQQCYKRPGASIKGAKSGNVLECRSKVKDPSPITFDGLRSARLIKNLSSEFQFSPMAGFWNLGNRGSKSGVILVIRLKL